MKRKIALLIMFLSFSNFAFASGNDRLEVYDKSTGKTRILADGSSSQVIKTDGAGNISYTTIPVGSTNSIQYNGGSNVFAAIALNSTSTNKYVSQASSGAPTFRQVAYTDLSVPVTTVSSTSYNTLATDYIINVTSTGSPVTIDLLAAATAGAGKVYVIKDAAAGATANNITIDANASEKIDGALTYKLVDDYESVTIYCDGSNWFII